MPMAGGDESTMQPFDGLSVVNIAHSRKFHELNQSRSQSSRAFPAWTGSSVASYPLIGQTALSRWVVHHSSAFLAAYAGGGSLRHSDFVFCAAGARMRAGQPFHEFRH
jgi:hypothetical protein